MDTVELMMFEMELSGDKTPARAATGKPTIKQKMQSTSPAASKVSQLLMSANVKMNDLQSAASYLASRLPSWAVVIRETGLKRRSGVEMFKHLRHRFILITTDAGEELIIEPDFVQHFQVSGASAFYQSILAAFPAPLVVSGSELRDLVWDLAGMIEQEMREQGRSLPPWRKLGSLLTKWFPGSDGIDTPVVPAPPVVELPKVPSLSLSLLAKDLNRLSHMPAASKMKVPAGFDYDSDSDDSVDGDSSNAFLAADLASDSEDDDVLVSDLRSSVASSTSSGWSVASSTVFNKEPARIIVGFDAPTTDAPPPPRPIIPYPASPPARNNHASSVTTARLVLPPASPPLQFVQGLQEHAGRERRSGAVAPGVTLKMADALALPALPSPDDSPLSFAGQGLTRSTEALAIVTPRVTFQGARGQQQPRQLNRSSEGTGQHEFVKCVDRLPGNVQSGRTFGQIWKEASGALSTRHPAMPRMFVVKNHQVKPVNL